MLINVITVSLLRKTKKKKKHTKFNEKDIADNKQFWRTVKPLLSDKTEPREKIIWWKMKQLLRKMNKMRSYLIFYFLKQ